MTFYLLKLVVLEEGLDLVAVKGREGKTTLLWGNSGIMERERPPGKAKVKVKGLIVKEIFNNAPVSIHMQRKDLNQLRIMRAIKALSRIKIRRNRST